MSLIVRVKRKRRAGLGLELKVFGKCSPSSSVKGQAEFYKQDAEGKRRDVFWYILNQNMWHIFSRKYNSRINFTSVWNQLICFSFFNSQVKQQHVLIIVCVPAGFTQQTLILICILPSGHGYNQRSKTCSFLTLILVFLIPGDVENLNLPTGKWGIYFVAQFYPQNFLERTGKKVENSHFVGRTSELGWIYQPTLDI